MTTQGRSIGELAAEIGVNSSAIRFYETDGLLQPDDRTPSGYRVYRPLAEHRLRFLQRAKSPGLTLDDIKPLIDTPRARRVVQAPTLRRRVATNGRRSPISRRRSSTETNITLAMPTPPTSRAIAPRPRIRVVDEDTTAIRAASASEGRLTATWSGDSGLVVAASSLSTLKT